MARLLGSAVLALVCLVALAQADSKADPKGPTLSGGCPYCLHRGYITLTDMYIKPLSVTAELSERFLGAVHSVEAFRAAHQPATRVNPQATAAAADHKAATPIPDPASAVASFEAAAKRAQEWMAFWQQAMAAMPGRAATEGSATATPHSRRLQEAVDQPIAGITDQPTTFQQRVRAKIWAMNETKAFASTWLKNLFTPRD